MNLYLRKVLYKLATVTLFIVTARTAWAAPSISSISGTFSNGQDITISGSGFGANGPSVAIFDDFEAGTINQTIGTGAGNLANVGVWQADGTYPGYYTSSAAVSGIKSMGINWKTPLASKDVRVRLSGATDIFISYWWYVPSGSDFPGENGGEGTNWKQIWAYKNDDISGGDQTFVSVLGSGGPPENAFAFYETCDACPTSQYGNISLPMKGAWHRVWFYIKGSETTNGEMDYWDLNPSGGIVQNIHTTGVATLNAGAVYNWASVPGYGRNNSSGGSWAEYDDVYIATAASGNGQERIEICDQSDYASASMSKITLATPKAWATGSLTATGSAGAMNTSGSGNLVVGLVQDTSSGSGSITAGSLYTLINKDEAGATDIRGASEDLGVGSPLPAGTYNPDFTNANVVWGAAGAIFKQ